MKKIEYNDNETVTVRNEKTEITLPREDWNYLVAQYQGQKIGNGQSPEQHARCIIISNHNRILEHKKQINEFREPISDEITTEARRITHADFFYEYLKEHCKYDLGETLFRHAGGHRMSEGMRRDVDAAIAYADHEIRDTNADFTKFRDQAYKNLTAQRDYSKEVSKIPLTFHR